MKNRFFILLQYITPQHALSALMGWLAESRIKWLKNLFIRSFCHFYTINMQEAAIADPLAHPSFNDFFTRKLKPGARPLCPQSNTIACPADGTIAELGHIHDQQLMQAKNSYFTLAHLFAGDNDASQFTNGSFATIYLAPHNYHRVHMPVTGTLKKTIYIPGKLFSVNKITSDLISNLYCRNERLICLFETEFGPMAVILVGAMIVGSMQTVWMDQPIRDRQILKDSPLNITLNKGDEMGLFKLGSTVIVLFSDEAATWLNAIEAGNIVNVGQEIGQATD